MITGLKVLNDRLHVFKQNSTWAYDEIQLKKKLTSVGAYNHNVIKEIDGILYTFSPSGVFATNGFSAKKISDPIDDILKLYFPTFDPTYQRVVTDCFAGVFDKKYVLYLSRIFSPSFDNRLETLRGVTLVYDTVKNNWTMYTGLVTQTNLSSFQGLFSMPNFVSGENSSIEGILQSREALFAGGSVDNGATTKGGLFRMFENIVRGGDTAQNERGAPITGDMVADSTGTPISALIRTGWIDQGSPETNKQFSRVRVLLEKGDVSVSYRVDTGDFYTDWEAIGSATTSGKILRFPAKARGYRIQLSFANNQVDTKTILNGFVVEDTEVLSKK